MRGVVASWSVVIIPLCVALTRTYVAARLMARDLSNVVDLGATACLITSALSSPGLWAAEFTCLYLVGEAACAALLIVGAFTRSTCAALLMFNVVTLYVDPSIWNLSQPEPFLFLLYSSACLLVLTAYGPGQLSWDARRRRAGGR